MPCGSPLSTNYQLFPSSGRSYLTASITELLRSRLAYLVIGALSVTVCSTIATSESASYAGPTHPVDAAFFGMHVHHAASGTAWPAVPFADWRLWDAGVTWPQLEPAPGKWNFDLLDRYTQIAAEHKVDILLTLGLTPTWASSRPDESSAYGKGNAAEPRHVADWEQYVRIVATRYKGVIHNYEIWNEPNVKGTFTGSPQAMLELSRAAYRILKSVDPTVTVVSPAATAGDGVPWLGEYLHRGGCAYADVIAYHFYVTPEPPETMIPLIKKVNATIRRHDCQNKPVWNTESGWASPKRFSSEEEAAGYLMRTYFLNWLLGVQRCFWYAWDNHNWSTLDLTSRSTNKITGAGAAYGVLHSWMLGSVLRSCERERSGIWICQLDRGSSSDRVVWSENGRQSFTIPTSWKVQTTTSWSGQREAPAIPLSIGPAPVLLSSQ